MKTRCLICYLFILTFIGSNCLLFSQSKPVNNKPNRVTPSKPQNKPPKKPQISPKYPDKYSPLDNSKTIKVITDEMINNTIESARQSYLKAQICLQKNDTSNAINQFEKALSNLNKLAIYPEIENNDEYNELLSSVTTDFNTIAKRSNASEDLLFVPKENLFTTEEQNNDTAIITNGKTTTAPELFSRPPSADTSGNYIFAIPKIDELTIPISENGAIDFAVDFLTKGRGKGYLPKWMERSSRWFPMMQEIAEQEGMPKEILFIAFYESGLDPFAESNAKAVGLWQFMYPTGVDYGLNKRQSIWVDERRDPLKSTRAAMRYFRDLYLEFNDWYLALNAYNWGWGNVRRAIRLSNQEKPTFWDIRNQKNIKMPKEAREYVPLFIAILQITSDPLKYGIDVTKLNYKPEFKYDIIELEQATNLSAVSKSIGVGVEEIRELNPELLYDISPPDRKYYRLRVPVGSSKDFKTNFAKLPKEETQPSLNHKVERGETIISVAEKFDVSIDELIQLNNITSKSIYLEYNSDLKIPIGGKNYSQSTLAFANSNLISKSELAASNSNMYVAMTNESIYDISNKFRIKPANLRNWNNIPIDQDSVAEGSVLIISNTGEINGNPAGVIPTQNVVSMAFAQINNSNLNSNNASRNTNSQQNSNVNSNNNRNTNAPQPIQNTTTHKVQKGETLYGIATKYGMKTNELAELNSEKIKDDKIIIGDILIVNKTADSSTNRNLSQQNNKPTQQSTQKPKDVIKYHTVVSGDNLSKIANQYKVQVSNLISLNKNIKPDKLSLGQKIRVK